ncbi:hypothetical protein [Delftia sp. HK171]|uniref:hypothetical protein n=1 Tax=Delftia sp. HK171 TaxID=1920191 RepID=UPI00115052EB|nr:hypothetical protein [Delftia sp. HK171]TQL73068.1 hypothetical protein FB549_3807 [Delftia sp. HK171]
MARPKLIDPQMAQHTLPNQTASVGAQEDGIDQERFAADMQLMRQQQGALTVESKQSNERMKALALELNYQGSTDPAVLENSARDAIKRIGMAIFELGGYLILLKERCAHGEFLPVLDRLDISVDSAGRYMAVTRRFANSATSRNLESLGFSKMVELLPLDDGQVDSLITEGQTGELDLDDVSRMSVKELRAAVRKERAEAAKQKNRAERQEAVNAEMHEEVRQIKLLPEPEQAKRLHAEAGKIQDEVMGMVRGNLRRALEKLNESGQDQSLFMAGMVGQLIAELTMLRDEFNLVEVGSTPEWEKWSQAQGAASTSTAPN